MALLAQATIGRVALSVGAIPEIFPVHFCVSDNAILFRAGQGTNLYTASRKAVVAFEVDDFDIEARRGWSVMVVGPSDEVGKAEEIATAMELLDDGWVPEDRDHVLRITPHRISGRRIAEYDGSRKAGL